MPFKNRDKIDMRVHGFMEWLSEGNDPYDIPKVVEEWETVCRPGYSGNKKEEIIKGYNDKYGVDNWRIVWQFGDNLLDFVQECMIYEDGYFMDSLKNPKKYIELFKTAREIYDHDESDIKSGLDYMIQLGNATHLQDIAIRRVGIRRGWKFKGNKLIQVRSHKTYWGSQFSPGKVPFHLPEMIIVPHLYGWWEDNSIEQQYQDAKTLQIKK